MRKLAIIIGSGALVAASLVPANAAPLATYQVEIVKAQYRPARPASITPKFNAAAGIVPKSAGAAAGRKAPSSISATFNKAAGSGVRTTPLAVTKAPAKITPKFNQAARGAPPKRPPPSGGKKGGGFNPGGGPKGPRFHPPGI